MQDIEWKISTSPIEYPYALDFMEKRVNDIIAGNAPEMIWLLEHPALYTSGTSAKIDDLLEPNKFPVFATGRGGEYTYHGPGQRIAYVMLDLKTRMQKPDIRQYIQNLEKWIINTLKDTEITGETRDKRIGIWVKNEDGSEDKIAALGVRVRKWVTYHGISININPDLSNFSGIVPCGITNHGVTSITKVNHDLTPDIDTLLQNNFYKVFSK